MRHFLIGLLLIANFVQAQTIVAYRASMVNGQQKIFAIYSDGHRSPVASMPSDRPKSRKGGKVNLTYAPEGIRQLNTAQFGKDKYFDPNFKLAIDFRDGSVSNDEMKRRGLTLFTKYTMQDPNEFNQLQFGEGMDYIGESTLHGPLEGQGYWHSTLEEIESRYQNTLPGAERGYFIANIETSQEWYPGNDPNVYPGYPGFAQGTYGPGRNGNGANWENIKGFQLARLESTGESNVSLETLANRGFGAWNAEKNARRGNRLIVLLVSQKRKSQPGGLISFGAAMYQGEPDSTNAYNTGGFADSDGNNTAFPPDGDGNSTINGRKYKLSGSFYEQESVNSDYYYDFNFTIGQQDASEIWDQQLPGKTNYPYIWSKIKPEHIVAKQLGHIQANDYRIKNRGGNNNRPVIVQRQLEYEDNRAGVREGENFDNRSIARVPGNMNAGCLDYGNGGSPCDDFPKIWQEPYKQYSMYVCARWFFANRPGSAYYIFHGGGTYNLATEAGINYEYHPITSIYQARHDMQPYERFLGQSTLVEKPEVQANQAGAYQSYDAIQAYNYKNGSRGPKRPVFQIRYLAQAGGYRVLVLGGDDLQHFQERTHNVRYQLPGMSGPVTFAIKLRGPSAQVFEFIVSGSDANQTYTANFSPQVGFEKAGYAGRVGVLGMAN